MEWSPSETFNGTTRGMEHKEDANVALNTCYSQGLLFFLVQNWGEQLAWLVIFAAYSQLFATYSHYIILYFTLDPWAGKGTWPSLLLHALLLLCCLISTEHFERAKDGAYNVTLNVCGFKFNNYFCGGFHNPPFKQVATKKWFHSNQIPQKFTLFMKLD